MPKNKKKHIEHKEIEKIALDIGVQQWSKDLLLFTSQNKNYKTILSEPFRSKHYSVLFALEGTVSLRINMFDYKLSKNTIVFASPDTIKEFKESSDDCRIAVLLFTGSFINNSIIGKNHSEIINTFINKTHYFLNIDDNYYNELSQLILILNKRLDLNQETKNVENLIFFSILNILQELLDKQVNTPLLEKTNKRNNLVIQFFQLLPKHIQQNRDVKFYAQKLGITPKHLSYVLKEKTEKPALKHIANMLILESKVMLNNHENSISNIADALGFPDQFSFCKYFKLNSGLTPSEYRNSNLAK